MNYTYVIAEMACSHEGDINLAKVIIDASVEAGADAVQLQIWNLKQMMSPQRKEFQLLEKLEFDQEEWKSLVNYSRSKYPDLDIYVCVYEHSSIEFISGLGVDGFKINSSDLSNPLVLKKVAATNKPINLSIGASSIQEIQNALEIISDTSSSPVTLMYGHQSFPTKPESVNMSYMQTMSYLFGLPIGYQDHSDADSDAAYWLPASSLGMGVTILEKHLTHDRSLKGIDHESALNPDEFIAFVDMVRIIDTAKGLSTPRPFSEEENKYREFQKKSIVASRDLDKGHILTTDDLAFMRAQELGYSPEKLDLIIGKIITCEIKAYQTITEKDFT